jgi:hypothetical protein
MLVLLNKKEMDLLAEIRNSHMAEREGFRLYDRGRLTKNGLIKKLRRNFEETERILLNLGKRGI